jgi:hypothetical protein
MELYSYVVARDYGFAPNPFNGYCTLATCKPAIRRDAKIGDWVIGTGSKKHEAIGKLIYAMEVTEKMTFNEYWNDRRFQVKKPKLNGSIKQAFGDNIYYRKQRTGEWHQENSHHSHDNGVINMNNLRRDTRYDSVLVSSFFYYFGVNAKLLPDSLRAICKSGQGYKKNHDPALVVDLITWVKSNFHLGYSGDPMLFGTFKRYNGL